VVSWISQSIYNESLGTKIK